MPRQKKLPSLRTAIKLPKHNAKQHIENKAKHQLPTDIPPSIRFPAPQPKGVAGPADSLAARLLRRPHLAG